MTSVHKHFYIHADLFMLRITDPYKMEIMLEQVDLYGANKFITDLLCVTIHLK
jgi:hypothetical protein